MLVCSRRRRLDSISEAELLGLEWDWIADGPDPQKLDSEMLLLNVLLLRRMACKPSYVMLTALAILVKVCASCAQQHAVNGQGIPSDKAGPGTACSQRTQKTIM